MITEQLEKLLLSGEAVFKTHTWGTSGGGTIHVPDGKRAIITKIIYYPFCDAVEFEDLSFSAQCQFHLQLKSLKSSNFISLRTSYNMSKTSEAAPGIELMAQMAPPIIMDTFLTHDDDVRLMVAEIPDSAGWGITILRYLAGSGEFDPPNGWGFAGPGAPVVMEAGIGLGNFTYKPPGRRSSALAVRTDTDQFKTDYVAVAALNNPLVALRNFSYPLINFNYALVNLRSDYTTQSSN